MKYQAKEVWGKDLEAVRMGGIFVEALFDDIAAMEDDEFLEALDGVSDRDYMRLGDPIDQIGATLYAIHYGGGVNQTPAVRRGKRANEDPRWTELRRTDWVMASALESWATEYTPEWSESEAICFYFDAMDLLKPEAETKEEIQADAYAGQIWLETEDYASAMSRVQNDLTSNQKPWGKNI